jgi:hypothetical protein
MEADENHRQELRSMTDESLKTLVEMRFVWQDSVTAEERARFYERQAIAEDVLAERHGVPPPK